MNTYRACIYGTDQSDMVMTGPQHAALPDADLIAEAIAEAWRADIVRDYPDSEADPDEPRINIDDFIDSLYIGEWSDD